MAHFAEIDSNNNVIRVIVIHNNELLDEYGTEQETKGAEFCRTLFGGNWIQTSYNASIRKNFAGPGFTYSIERDAFIPPKPFPSWVLDADTCRWVSPVPLPDSGNYLWDEESLSWIEIQD